MGKERYKYYTLYLSHSDSGLCKGQRVNVIYTWKNRNKLELILLLPKNLHEDHLLNINLIVWRDRTHFFDIIMTSSYSKVRTVCDVD